MNILEYGFWKVDYKKELVKYGDGSKYPSFQSTSLISHIIDGKLDWLVHISKKSWISKVDIEDLYRLTRDVIKYYIKDNDELEIKNSILETTMEYINNEIIIIK
jgi:hypothetical protein